MRKIEMLNLGEVYRYPHLEQSMEKENKYLTEYIQSLIKMTGISEAMIDREYERLNKRAIKENLTVFGLDNEAEPVSTISKSKPEHEFRVGVFADREESSLDDWLHEKTGHRLRDCFPPVREWAFHTLPDWNMSYRLILNLTRVLDGDGFMRDEWYIDALAIALETCHRAKQECWAGDHVIRWNHKNE